MRRRANAITSSLLVLALTLAGCGAAGSKGPKILRIGFLSPAITNSGKIPARFTCDGKNISPPLEWNVIPPGTKEIAVFLFKLTLIRQEAGRSSFQTRLKTQWAVSGLQPTLRRIPTGKLPPKAILARNQSGSERYSMCPAKGNSYYLFRIYALSHNLPVRSGIEDNELLSQVNSAPLGQGEFLVSYTRT